MDQTFYRISLPQLEKFTGKESLRLALLADFHLVDPAPALASLRDQTPDLILMAGDFLLGRRLTRSEVQRQLDHSVLPFLSRASAIAPSFCSLGNHDRYLEAEDLEKLEDQGVRVLDNTYIRTGGLVIGGLTSGRTLAFRSDREAVEEKEKSAMYGRFYFFKRFLIRPEDEPRPDLSWLEAFEKEEGPKILLSHHPEYWAEELADRPIDLTLSGHAHGGQFRFPWKGRMRGLFAPGQGFFPRYTEGVHHGPHGALVVSRGLANTAGRIPRLGNPTEVVYIEFVSESSR